MTVVTVSSNGQIVIPGGIRKILEVKPKSKLFIKLSDDKQSIILKPLPEDPIESACGFFTISYPLTQTLLEVRQYERKAISEKFT